VGFNKPLHQLLFFLFTSACIWIFELTSLEWRCQFLLGKKRTYHPRLRYLDRVPDQFVNARFAARKIRKTTA